MSFWCTEFWEANIEMELGIKVYREVKLKEIRRQDWARELSNHNANLIYDNASGRCITNGGC